MKNAVTVRFRLIKLAITTGLFMVSASPALAGNLTLERIAHNVFYRTDRPNVCALEAFKDPAKKRVYLSFSSGRQGSGFCSHYEGSTMMFSCPDNRNDCQVVDAQGTTYQSLSALPDGGFILRPRTDSGHVPTKYYIHDTRVPEPISGQNPFDELPAVAGFDTRANQVCSLWLHKDTASYQLFAEFTACAYAGETMIFQCQPSQWVDCRVVEGAGTDYFSIELIPGGRFVLRSAAKNSLIYK